jgi:hypothetical protein
MTRNWQEARRQYTPPPPSLPELPDLANLPPQEPFGPQHIEALRDEWRKWEREQYPHYTPDMKMPPGM